MTLGNKPVPTENRNIVILTGAGISEESGIPTFRGVGGLWTPTLINDIATPEGFNNNPEYAHRFYNQARALAREAAPNEGHIALARLAAEWPGNITIITQNVDDLHTRAQRHYAPSARAKLIYMHGELNKARWTDWNNGKAPDWNGDLTKVVEWNTDITEADVQGIPGGLRALRPHVVLFGEEPLESDAVVEAIQQLRPGDLYLAVGTSGHVEPASSFVDFAKRNGAHTIDINANPTAVGFDEVRHGAATQEVPKLVEALLREAMAGPWAKRTVSGQSAAREHR